MNVISFKPSRVCAILAIILTLSAIFVPLSISSDTDATPDDIYTYVIHTDGTVEGDYESIGTSSSSGSYTSTDNSNSGSWTWDEDGYGPFNSFYAAFDPTQDNRMICHLDPDDLTRSVDGTSIAGEGYNIMWCLPTVYWKTSGSNLVLTNDPDSGGTAYAHTVSGRTYEYIGIGVYEASSDTIGGKNILTSISGEEPLDHQKRATFREWANNQLVDTAGDGVNGHAMLWNFYQWQLYRFCALTVMGSWDSQGVAGNGNVDGNDVSITGSLDKSGPYAGTKGEYYLDEYGANPVKVFIENAWGSVSEFVDGIMFVSAQYYIDQSAVPTDATKSGTYVKFINSYLPNGWGSSPSTTVQIWGMPTESKGTFESGLYDDVVAPSFGTYSLFVGGSYEGVGAHAGISSMNVNWGTYASLSTVGGRLTIMFDDDPMVTNTVTFVSNGTIVDTQSVPTGLTAIAPSVELYGYTFQGWFTSDGMEFSPSLVIDSDMTFIARWEGILEYTTNPVSDGIVTAIDDQPGTVSFKATTSKDYTSLIWDFGDGSTSTNTYATHFYDQPGTYTVTLTVFNNYGSDTTEFIIEVPEMAPGGGGNDLLLWVAVGLVCIISGGLVIRRFL